MRLRRTGSRRRGARIWRVAGTRI
ncbi:hypothetical protein [Nonomuraea sp. NPDC050643]